ncbi:hypothetical protein Sango_2837900 [Sesamum angolense]|uniref:Uncharacterized protein n=1 Tax=Sesamum angolense TaxID=2727404 RepID=A0AAE1T7D5_9LAMI|nr:hypothetical protein Sango_2837900 [Sesamum angolense]
MPPDRLFDLSNYNQDGELDNDRFHDVLHAGEQPLWNSCTQSQLGVVLELVNIKAKAHISEHIYDRISQLAHHILPRDQTLSLDYYSAKKLIKDFGLPVEKIDACKNGCMLYWKDHTDLEYCKFGREVRYKPTRERNSNHKKTLYVILRLFLNELYEHHHSEDPIIEVLVATKFKDWFKRRVKSDLNYTDNELLKLLLESCS